MKTVIWSMTLAGTITAALASPPPENGPIIPPRESHPFGAKETRPLWDRPPAPPSGPERIEPDLNRGNGRVEDATTFDLKQIRRNQIDPSGTLSALHEQERQDDLEQIRLKNDRDANRQKRYEREDQALAKERRDWSTLLQRENAAGGAVVDQMALDRMEADYRAAITTAAQQRDTALSQLAGDHRAPADAEKRAQILTQFEAAREAAAAARQARKEVILGHK